MVISATGENCMETGDGGEGRRCQRSLFSSTLADNSCLYLQSDAQAVRWRGCEECTVSNRSFSVILTLDRCCTCVVTCPYWPNAGNRCQKLWTWVMYERAGLGRDAGGGTLGRMDSLKATMIQLKAVALVLR